LLGSGRELRRPGQAHRVGHRRVDGGVDGGVDTAKQRGEPTAYIVEESTVGRGPSSRQTRMEDGMPSSIEQRVVVSDSGELLAPGIDLLRGRGVTVDVPPAGTSAEDVAAHATDAPVILIGVLPFRAPAVTLLRKTGLLIRAGIGYDIIDVDAATARGIWVANVPDYCVDEVADHAALLLMAAWRRLTELEAVWRAGKWVNSGLVPPVHRTRGRRLGVVGFGRIGRAVGERARGFGWEVVAYDPMLADDRVRAAGASPVGLDELFETSDAVSLHSPLTPETRHMVNAERLSRVKPGFVLVNTSRGGLIDIDALDAALESGRVAAVGLDVLEDEPAPDLSRPIFQRPNVLLTPHLAWYSIEARVDLALYAAEEAYRYISGERPKNLVNPDARQGPG
jgi:D-3-phosphoglycerate dehydrogenase / 2-oxoglutarate reductase